jgi:hypothetical protein
VVAQKLRDHPGEWFIVAADDRCRAHVLSQTAYRIGLNYEGGRGLVDFASDDEGRFEAVFSADPRRANQHAPAEIRARYVLTDPAAERPD